MKILAPLSAFALAILFACQAAPTTPTLPHGQRIGQDILAQQSVRFSVVDATPKNFFDKTVLVEAKVKAVCAKAGCWMQVEDEGRTAMVRWETGCGGKYKFPMEAVGKKVLIQVSFYPKSISEADVEHLQEEAGGAKVVIPREGYEFNASSVLILDT
jgi:hypothetical protein